MILEAAWQSQCRGKGKFGSWPYKRWGTQRLQVLIEDLLKSYVNTRKVDNLGYLRREWLGPEAMAALRAGQRLARRGPLLFEENLNAVALPNVHRSHLLRGIVQTIPADRSPGDLLEWRLQLDLGI